MITLKNVQVHNLKGVDLTLKAGELIVFTGVSGCGKSSLAFDTIYMEGQRRYIESLSSYARRHLGEFPKPEADSIEGISPTIAIEQKTTGKNPRSTVGTLTGIYDFLRVLFAKVATPYCPVSLDPLTPQSCRQILEEILVKFQGRQVLLLIPFAKDRKGTFKEELFDLIRRGFTRARIDGKVVRLEEDLSLDGSVSHEFDLVLDRIEVGQEQKTRLGESLQAALEEGKGLVKVLCQETEEEALFSEHAYSKASGLSYLPLEPSDFSFNHPLGMCQECQGLGLCQEFDLEKIIDPSLSIAEDCCKVASSFQTIRYGNIYQNLARIYHFDLHTPWSKLPQAAKKAFLYGIESKWVKMQFTHPQKKTSWVEYVAWKGVLSEAKQRYQAAKSESYRKNFLEYCQEATCSACKGSRIKPYPSAARLGGKTIQQITCLTVQQAKLFFQELTLTPHQQAIGQELVKELKERLSFLEQVGLQYLSLDRTAPTLSGGEGQRVRLASQIGSGLVGATYILDEPSIGLHPRDNHKLLQTLIHLKDKGNTVLVVEHDEETILAADTIVELGPLAGKQGGRVLVCGPLDQLLSCQESQTGAYLLGKLQIPAPKKRRKPIPSKRIRIEGATHHNLQNLSVSIPLHLLVAITGVSGSGKSSLILDTLFPFLSNALHGSDLPVGSIRSMQGYEKIDKVIAIDQSPIGRTPRSNPATYIKLFDEIRDLFAMHPESLAKGFTAGRFSFNVKEGSCPFCSGMGMVKVDMDFLEDEWICCEHCLGKRFDDLTLSVQWKGKNIHDILEMTVEEALLFFADYPKIRTKLSFLDRVGLSYIRLGQSSPTLSGGEAQRIKIAKELSRPSTENTLYILDEPTTGLHFYDIKRLVEILHSFVDQGSSVIVIEHNLDLIKSADWVIDLGPEAGPFGGAIVGEGSVEKISKLQTPTGIALASFLAKKQPKPSSHKIPSSQKQQRFLTVQGAMQNNLQNIDLSIPLGKITVCTGPSGSGKSSLAFETIFAEGQRRYTDCLSHYARQFIKQSPKPKVEHIEGLLASIAIEQKHHAGNPRSTIGTLTEIYDFLRILYAHVGTAFCPETGEEIRSISKEYVLEKAKALPLNTKLILLAPMSLPKGETFASFQQQMIKQGFLRIRLNSEFFELEESIPWDPKKKNDLFLVIDRLILTSGQEERLLESIEQASILSHPKNHVVLATATQDLTFNLSFTVESTGKSYSPITPHTFSFNTDKGMCFDCQGLGFQYGADLTTYKDLLNLSPMDLLLLLCKDLLGKEGLRLFYESLVKLKIRPDTPLSEQSSDQVQRFFQGGASSQDPHPMFSWKGLNQVLIQYATKASSLQIRSILSSLLQQNTCLSCHGTRLSPLARNVKIAGMSIADLCQKSIEEAIEWMSSLSLPTEKKNLLQEPLTQVNSRLLFLKQLGLGYLSSDRSAPTLSGGEMQRIRLSRQLGCGLTGCLYVLDEPTIGLHPHDNHLLNQALIHLKDLGNTLLLVEHDPMTLQIADHIIDFGPGAGKKGGRILSQGSLQEISQDPKSLTGAYLSGRRGITAPKQRRLAQKHLFIKDVSLHNLQHFSVSIPLGVMTCLTGVSGSGKSTLLMDLIRPEVERVLSLAKETNSPSFIEGLEQINKLIVLEQNPIGTTNRADISTYTDLLSSLRALYASLPKAKALGLEARHFSFNHKKGMCKSCWGLGTKTVSLQFLPSVKVPCDSCKGFRLNDLSLQVSYKEKNLGQALQMEAEAAREFFSSIPKAVKILDSLIAVGLGYLSLGQEIATLSGGEAQRLRLSKELAKRSTGKTLYLLDEPSIGLHSCDIEKLLVIFQALVEKGNTVILIEHNLDLIAGSDFLIDLGPKAGSQGGKLVCTGTPEEVACHQACVLAPFLKKALKLP